MVQTALSQDPQSTTEILGTGAARCLKEFDDYLSRVRGLAPNSRRIYCFHVKRFLADFCGADAPDWSSLRAEDLTAFVQREASYYQRHARALPGQALRTLLRYLRFTGQVQSGMEAAIPQMPQWKQAGLPRYLPAPEVERVIGSVLDHTAQGRRNYTMLLLLARMGLRAEEVMKLTLDDIDWREGVIRIRATKSHRDRMMPLSQEVGAALYIYLEHARPPSGSRALFLRLRPPFKSFHDSSAISRMVRRTLIRAGILWGPRPLRTSLGTPPQRAWSRAVRPSRRSRTFWAMPR